MDGTTLADRLQEKVAGVCLIVGALLLAPTTYFEYGEGRLFWAGTFGLVLYAVQIPGLLAVARLVRRPAPRLSVVAGLLATLGCVGGACFQVALLYEWAARAAGTPEELVSSIMTVTEQRVFPFLVILGIQFPVALLLLAIGLVRTGAAPTWVAALLGVGAVLWPVGHIGSLQLVTHLAETLLLIPLVWLGLRSLIGATPQGVAVPGTT